jgi:hypothetical protein
MWYNQEALPSGIRCLIYSYMTYSELWEKIQKVSKKERKALVKSNVLDQPRSLKIIITDLVEESD